MHGKLTGIVLGAGASFCYSGGTSGIPTQHDIVGRLFMGVDGDGVGAPSMTDTFGLRHSFRLAQYLRAKFALPEDPTKRYAKLDFWLALQGRGIGLESLYAEIEDDPAAAPQLLDDFEAIVRAAVLAPTAERQPLQVCQYHRALSEALEPGDYIIDFNWDTAMADALLYFCHFWFPSTGFGVPVLGTLLAPCQKAHRLSSLVTLYHVHGSAALFEAERLGDASRPGVLFVGPRQWSTGTSLMAIMGNDPWGLGEATPKILRKFTEEEEDRASKGWIFLRDRWFRPVFVPPSRHKPQYNSWYCSEVRRSIHSLLPQTERIVVAGYSFPAADQPHLKRIFVDRVFNKNLEATVINPQNNDEAFRGRAREILPAARLDFTTTDFRQFCESLQ